MPSKPPPPDLPLLLSPLVPDSLAHNNRTLLTLHSPPSFLLGLCAGILSLHSLSGFVFYLLGSLAVSFLIQLILVGSSSAGGYFPGNRLSGGGHAGGHAGAGEEGKGAWRDVWFGGGVLGEGVSGFVLGWAGVGGVLR
ncbi:hypothetical protein FQN54_008176 [Arachnomyces sp. PD_36]|nr:hypothetical protein FQN54_008176 [Arachnomyces sp. PD_36]